MRNRMVCLWRPERGMMVEELDNKIMLFGFQHIIDLRRVLELGPCIFDSSLMALKELKLGENSLQVELFVASFWVQVHDLMSGYHTTSTGKALGNYMG
ncbi:hypothetical protein LINPERPRIM_LOCUS40855 [Linum perenne]